MTTVTGSQASAELRLMPSGDGGWYWEVIKDGVVVVCPVAWPTLNLTRAARRLMPHEAQS